MQTIKLTEQQAEGLQTFVTNHIMSCKMSIYDDTDEDFEPYELYCGCDVCDTREYLMATFDYLEKANILKVE